MIDKKLFIDEQSYNNFIKCYEASQTINNLISNGSIVITDQGEVLENGFSYHDIYGNLVIQIDNIIYIGWEWEDDLIYVGDEEVKDFFDVIEKFKVAKTYENIKL
jgi:hypothetical protein